jgi:hypothetical protein
MQIIPHYNSEKITLTSTSFPNQQYIKISVITDNK